MTVVAIYDLHGNLPALNAVLAEIEPLGVDRIVIGGDVAFGPLVFPRSDEEILTSVTSEERLRRILSAVTQKTVICGHTHVQFDRRAGDTRVVNAGSVGMPYDEPGAYWALLGPTIELRRTLYDRDQASTMFLTSGHPLIETFLQNLEHPTSADEATAFFEKMAVRKDQDGNG